MNNAKKIGCGEGGETRERQIGRLLDLIPVMVP